MGAACSRTTKVTQISIAAKSQNSSSTDELFMNFGRPKTYHTATANVMFKVDDKTDIVSSLSSLEMAQDTTDVNKNKKENGVQQDLSETPISPDKRESKVTTETVAIGTKATIANTGKGKTLPQKKSSVDSVTKKVGAILDKIIPPESPVQSLTRLGRQSRLMHADLNTVVSYDARETGETFSKKGKKPKKRKGKSTIITVNPFTVDEETNIGNNLSPESPPLFQVCKHGIPIVEDLNDEEAIECDRCERPGSRGGRELQTLLKQKHIERITKKKKWAKRCERRGSRQDCNPNMAEKALQEFFEAKNSELKNK